MTISRFTKDPGAADGQADHTGRRCGARGTRRRTAPSLCSSLNAGAAAISSLTPPPIEYAIGTSNESYGEPAKSARRTATEHKRVLHRAGQLDLAHGCRYSSCNVCHGRQSGAASFGGGPAQQQGPHPQPLLPARPRDFGQARLCAALPGSRAGGRRAVPHLRLRQAGATSRSRRITSASAWSAVSFACRGCCC